MKMLQRPTTIICTIYKSGGWTFINDANKLKGKLLNCFICFSLDWKDQPYTYPKIKCVFFLLISHAQALLEGLIN